MSLARNDIMAVEGPDHGSLTGRKVLIIVENLPLPFDRRVWQEAKALTAAGATVSVICPTGKGFDRRYEEIEGIHIYRHPLPTEGRGALGFLREYAAALFWETLLSWKVFFSRGFDVIQACNPPDLVFLIAAPFKLMGRRFIFDHHDSCPELYLAKFARRDFFYRLLCLAERCTFGMADRVITANESYREHAIATSGQKPEDVTAVYSVPELSRIRRVEPDQSLRAGARVVLGYVGIIADQDGVDQLVHMMRALVDQGEADGVRAVVVGDGPALGSVKMLAEELGVQSHVHFTGYLSGDALMAALSSFDIGIIPDPVNPYNDKISMNKVFEYSALGVPSVAYDLAETKRLLRGTGSYADDATPAGLARACFPLIHDEEYRRARGAEAKALADAEFVWAKEAAKYIGVYEGLIPGSPAGRNATSRPQPAS